MLRILTSIVLALEIMLFTVGCAMQDAKEKVAGVSSDVEPSGQISAPEEEDDEESVSSISLGALSSGKSKISIPLECFGSSPADVEDATFDIELNGGTLTSNVAAEKYYHEDDEAVVFYLSNLESGDDIEITLTTDEGTSVYSGSFSSSASVAK